MVRVYTGFGWSSVKFAKQRNLASVVSAKAFYAIEPRSVHEKHFLMNFRNSKIIERLHVHVQIKTREEVF